MCIRVDFEKKNHKNIIYIYERCEKMITDGKRNRRGKMQWEKYQVLVKAIRHISERRFQYSFYKRFFSQIEIGNDLQNI